MIKIVKSLAMIALVGAVALGITGAYFSDTETSENNIMQAGSLDLTLNGFNGEPATAVVVIEDMKPCITRYSAPITLHVSNNRARLYKHIVIPADSSVLSCETNGVTEPECTDQGGHWTGTDCLWPSISPMTEEECDRMGGLWKDGECYLVGPSPDENYLPQVTWFDLEVWVGDTPPTVTGEGRMCDPDADPSITTDCWKIIIPDGKITVAEIASRMIYLGTYGKDMEENKITIRQSFHMDKNAGNEYQSDKCTFDEEFMVKQVNAPVVSGACLPNDAGCTDCMATETVCNDGLDNDCDGLIDDEDPDCV